MIDSGAVKQSNGFSNKIGDQAAPMNGTHITGSAVKKEENKTMAMAGSGIINGNQGSGVK